MLLIEINWNPDSAELRRFSMLWLAAFGLAGLYVAWTLGCFAGSGQWKAPAVLWGVAAAVGAAGFISSRLVKPVYLGWMGLTFPLGWVFSHLILALIFFGVFTPVGIIYRIIRYDPLARRLDRCVPTYWTARPGPAPAARYFRQF